VARLRTHLTISLSLIIRFNSAATAGEMYTEGLAGRILDMRPQLQEHATHSLSGSASHFGSSSCWRIGSVLRCVSRCQSVEDRTDRADRELKVGGGVALPSDRASRRVSIAVCSNPANERRARAPRLPPASVHLAAPTLSDAYEHPNHLPKHFLHRVTLVRPSRAGPDGSQRQTPRFAAATPFFTGD
jgi:hypothetical protein